MSNKNKNKNKSGSSGSSSSSSSSSSASSSSTAATKKVERRPVLVLYGVKIKTAQGEVARIVTSLESWTKQENLDAEQVAKLGELLALGKEISPRIDEFSASFAALTTLGFVPSTTVARAPKFGPGSKVSVEPGDWTKHYTKSGIYEASELQNLTVLKVTATRELLCKTDGGREIVIRTAGHLVEAGAATAGESASAAA